LGQLDRADDQAPLQPAVRRPRYVRGEGLQPLEPLRDQL
jgi:hypothetical protein